MSDRILGALSALAIAIIAIVGVSYWRVLTDMNAAVETCDKLRDIGIHAEFKQPHVMGDYWCEITTDAGVYKLRTQ